ncbi:MAG: hypothetical protein KBD53_04050 [Candidatus Omnitrophica bacterium]|nr:hypothetical protein [Candidatus Omnitrophota bacterium]
MKRALSVLITFVFVCMVAAPAFALPAPVEKLKSGVVKVVKSPLNIYNHTKTEMDENATKPVGFTKGLIESPFFMIKDVGGGLTDIITFPVE